MTTKDLDAIMYQKNRAALEVDRLFKLFDEAYGRVLYNQFKSGGSVSYDELERVNFGQYLDLPVVDFGSIKYQRLENPDKDVLRFKSVFSANSTLGRHSHTDCSEMIYVEKGGFNVTTGSERLGTLKQFKLSEGEILNIPEGMEHQFSNTSSGETVITIEYIKIK